MTELDTLRGQLQEREAELLQTKLELIDTRIADLHRRDLDKEQRLRLVEASRTRFETLSWLAFGGGAVSLFNLIRTMAR